MAKVISVNISENKGEIKLPAEKIEVQKNLGIAGDAHAGNWHRQISLLAKESIDSMSALGIAGLVPGAFAENITTEGIVLHTQRIGSKFKVGEAILEITQIGKECHSDCNIKKQVGRCIMPTEGIFARVLQGGVIKPQDEITPLPDMAVRVIIASDKAFSHEREDASGPAIANRLRDAAAVLSIDVLPDEREQIAEKLKEYCDEGCCDIIFTSGGTGFAPRDVTPEATLDAVERRAAGIPEAMRAASMKITERAMLSRAEAGIRKKTLIINLPGSPTAAVECIDAVFPALSHAVETLRGESRECARK